MGSTGYLSTHVLDTVRGLPAAGVAIRLYAVGAASQRQLISEAKTNADGRTDSPLIPKGELQSGVYELVFHMGAYFAAHGLAEGGAFLDAVPIRFHVNDEDMHYHVPLLATPFSYSTYRGS